MCGSMKCFVIKTQDLLPKINLMTWDNLIVPFEMFSCHIFGMVFIFMCSCACMFSVRVCATIYARIVLGT